MGNRLQTEIRRSWFKEQEPGFALLMRVHKCIISFSFSLLPHPAVPEK
jgi:hypothetical protein